MSDLETIAQTTPAVTRQLNARLLRWSDDLAVIVFDTGEIGQFASRGAWSRAAVETVAHQALSRLDGSQLETDQHSV